jgi:hypothetical protein
MSDAPQSARLVRALNDAFRSSDDAAVETDLTEAVCAYVVELKRNGLPPERVLVEFKRVVAGLSTSRDNATDESRQAEAARRAITLCIKAYYHAAASED